MVALGGWGNVITPHGDFIFRTLSGFISRLNSIHASSWASLSNWPEMSETDDLPSGFCSRHKLDLHLVSPQLYYCETLCIPQPPAATSVGF